MARSERTDSDRALSMILTRQSQLYDLHTHLLGMGNASFWIDSILMNERVMPTNKTFRRSRKVRQDLCPLVWDQLNNSGFIKGQQTGDFFYYIAETMPLPDPEKGFDTIKDTIEQENFSPILVALLNEEFYGELLDRNLTFKKDFSYDVILKLSDLSKGLGVKEDTCDDIQQMHITEKLGIYPPLKINFQDWIIFNARKQVFEIVYGIQVEELCRLIYCDPDHPSKANALARSYIINAFSMCDAQGTPARQVDLHSFHGSFTPDFYPRRFALKDSVYCQRLDILPALIAHIIDRYRTCLPPVKYCEFSVSVNDLSRPWMFDVLRSVRFYDSSANGQINLKELTYIPTRDVSSFAQMVLQDHFPHLKFAFTGPELDKTENLYSSSPQVMYKFLAGFDRRKIRTTLFRGSNDALSFLLKYPEQAIITMVEEIVKSKKDALKAGSDVPHLTKPRKPNDGIFGEFLDKLDDLQEKIKLMPYFYDWVVGLDLFGDELGHPYCPFVTRPFINYIKNCRDTARSIGSKNIFGVRIHCGENVIFADDNAHAYRLFVAHMYIAFRCLRFLQGEVEYGIRIGHGIAFDRILGNSMSKARYRKSSVLLAEIREHAKHLMKTVAYEVNITSNEYLLGQTLRQGNNTQPLRLDGLFGRVPIILATDDDGIWPIDQCPLTHPGHQSLAAEYCRAISSGIIENTVQLTTILQNTKNFCFWNMGGVIPRVKPKHTLPCEDMAIHTTIIHPDIIRRLLILHKKKGVSCNPAFQGFSFNTQLIDRVEWINEYGALRVAFLCICANHGDEEDAEVRRSIEKDYNTLFGENKAEFNSIYESWRNIRAEFLFLEAEARPHRVELKQDETQHHIFSAPQKQKFVQPQNEILVDLIYRQRSSKCTIHAFVNDIDTEKLMEDFRHLVDQDEVEDAYRNIIVFLYTNTNEYQYVPQKLTRDFPLKINPHHTRRLKTKESFLYALCACNGAATAALHLISDTLSCKLSDTDTYVQFGHAEIVKLNHNKTTPPSSEQATTDSDVSPKDNRLFDSQRNTTSD